MRIQIPVSTFASCRHFMLANRVVTNRATTTVNRSRSAASRGEIAEVNPKWSRVPRAIQVNTHCSRSKNVPEFMVCNATLLRIKRVELQNAYATRRINNDFDSDILSLQFIAWLKLALTELFTSEAGTLRSEASASEVKGDRRQSACGSLRTHVRL